MRPCCLVNAIGDINNDCLCAINNIDLVVTSISMTAASQLVV